MPRAVNTIVNSLLMVGKQVAIVNSPLPVILDTLPHVRALVRPDP